MLSGTLVRVATKAMMCDTLRLSRGVMLQYRAQPQTAVRQALGILRQRDRCESPMLDWLRRPRPTVKQQLAHAMSRRHVSSRQHWLAAAFPPPNDEKSGC
jgi:hypothetical protein